MSKVELGEKLAAVDLNSKDLWDELDDANKKALKSEFFLLNRFVSNVEGRGRETKEHYVLAVNEYFNKHWNTLQKHPKLLWQLLCMCSDGQGIMYNHKFIPFKKKKGEGKRLKFLLQLYPSRKQDELEMMAELMELKDFKELAKDLGYSDKDIKDLF